MLGCKVCVPLRTCVFVTYSYICCTPQLCAVWFLQGRVETPGRQPQHCGPTRADADNWKRADESCPHQPHTRSHYKLTGCIRKRTQTSERDMRVQRKTSSGREAFPSSTPRHALLHVNVPVAADDVVDFPVNQFLSVTSSSGLYVNC